MASVTATGCHRLYVSWWDAVSGAQRTLTRMPRIRAETRRDTGAFRRNLATFNRWRSRQGSRYVRIQGVIARLGLPCASAQLPLALPPAVTRTVEDIRTSTVTPAHGAGSAWPRRPRCVHGTRCSGRWPPAQWPVVPYEAARAVARLQSADRRPGARTAQSTASPHATDVAYFLTRDDLHRSSLLLTPSSASSGMEASDILANIAFTTSGALVDCVDSAFLERAAPFVC